MAGILSQEEVDALLRGISDGEIESTDQKQIDVSQVVAYDLTSQDRIIRGRMPTLEMTNEKYARLLRTTLSSILRKMVNVTSLSSEMIKFVEYLRTIPVPTSLHLFKMEPLRGSCIFIIESRLIFALVDIVFGGTGKGSYRIEGREFTAIENNLIKKIVLNALSDMEKAWKGLADIKTAYLRTEINPQFVSIVAPTDVVVVMKFELEVEYTTGIITICIPYSTLEPMRDKLQTGYQSEQIEVDRGWMNRFKDGLMLAGVDVVAELGRVEINGRDLISLKKGDVLLLDQYYYDPLNVIVEDVLKYKAIPGISKGNIAFQITDLLTGKEVDGYGS